MTAARATTTTADDATRRAVVIRVGDRRIRLSLPRALGTLTADEQEAVTVAFAGMLARSCGTAPGGTE